jgi:hypothetical protein
MLSKIRTTSALGGQLWIKEPPWLKASGCVLELVCADIVFIFTTLSLPYCWPRLLLGSVRRFSELSKIICFSVSCQLFFAFFFFASRFRVFAQRTKQSVDCSLRIMSKHQYGTNHAAKPKLLSNLTCSDLGLDSAGQWLNAASNAWTALRLPLYAFLPRPGAKLICYFHS